MNALVTFLGYQKQIIRYNFSQRFRITRLRTKIRIEAHCSISKDFVFGKQVHIKGHVKILQGVILGNYVTVGSHACLSRIQVGDHSQIESGVKITGSGNGRIIVGRDSYIGINNILDWSENITIGDHVHIAGPSTGLWTHSSAKQAYAGISLADKSTDYRPVAPIIIENNVYIGGNCTIYPGVRIAHHSMVAPNSAVCEDVGPYEMVGGVPAKKIKHIV